MANLTMDGNRGYRQLMTSKTAASSGLGARLSILVPGARLESHGPFRVLGILSQRMTSPSNIHCNRRPEKQVISGLVCACLLVDSGSWAQQRTQFGHSSAGGRSAPLFPPNPRWETKAGASKFLKGHFIKTQRKVYQYFGLKGQ